MPPKPDRKPGQIIEMERKKRAVLSEKAIERSKVLVQGARELIEASKQAQSRAAEARRRTITRLPKAA